MAKDGDEAEIAQLERQPNEHAQLLVRNIQAGQRGFLVVAFLRLHNQAIALVELAPNLLRQTVLFVLGKVVQVQVHLLGKLHEFAVQSGFVVQAHRYRSGHQRYKAERNPTLSYEFARERLQYMAQTPASEPSAQLPPQIGHMSPVE